jgi:hypothetical protein
MSFSLSNKPLRAALYLSSIYAFMPAGAQAADGLNLSGSVRVRYEDLSGQSRAGFGENDQLYSLRTILTGEYRSGPWRTGVELYDSRAYGSRPYSAIGTSEVNVLEPVQAYIARDFKDAFGPGYDVTAQAGRFTLNLGSRRLVAADDYSNATNGYTGVKLDLTTPSNTKATFIYTLPQVRLPNYEEYILDNEQQFDREMGNLFLVGGIVTKPELFGATSGEISYFRLSEDDTPGMSTRNRELDTLSLRLIRPPKVGHVDYELETIYQSGTTHVEPYSHYDDAYDVSAGFVHADIGYSFSEGFWGPIKTRLSVEYDYASGDKPGGKYGRFDTLFGMRRADFAPDGIYSQIGRANISTPGVRLEIAPTARFDAFVVYRGLWLAEPTDSFSTPGVRDFSGQSGSFAGTQLEGRARFWLVPKLLRAEVNAAMIDKGHFLKTSLYPYNSPDTHYISVALTSSF